MKKYAWAALMSNIRRFIAKRLDYVMKRGESQSRNLMNPGPKDILWMKDILPKFTNPVELAVNASTRMLSDAKACMLLLKHR